MICPSSPPSTSLSILESASGNEPLLTPANGLGIRVASSSTSLDWLKVVSITPINTPAGDAASAAAY